MYSKSKPYMKTYQKIIVRLSMLILICGVLESNTIIAQGEILSINPPSAFSGETLHLIVQGSGTHFVQDMTEIVFQNCDIEVKSTEVSSPELVTFHIIIKSLSGSCVFYIETGKEIPDNNDIVFEIIPLEEEPEAMITIYPVQSVFISDFDFSNLQNLPLLFTISVYSPDNKPLEVYAELRHDKYGLVASANKDLENPGVISSFDNRQFDNYDKDKASDEIIESATGNGTIPPGLYTYSVQLLSANGQPFGDPVESEFYISESVSGIDIIAPGTSLDSDPEIIYESSPYFQWFGGLVEYTFTLYEVMEGQISADDIISNVPVYQMNGIATAEYVYPNFAEQLQEGKKYAWQISSGINTSSGVENIRSEVFWFIYQVGNRHERALDKIEIYPDDINLLPGDSLQINLNGFDINGDTLNIECEWQVIPVDGGKVNKQGLFIAGPNPGTVAVKALCGTTEDYVTVNILKRK